MVSTVLSSIMEKLCLRCPAIPATCLDTLYQADSSRRIQHCGNGWRAEHRAKRARLSLADAGDFSGSDLVDLQRVAAISLAEAWATLKRRHLGARHGDGGGRRRDENIWDV